MHGLAIAAPYGKDTLPHADFDRLAAFIHRVAGIKMPPSKHSMVEGRLRRRVIATGANSFAEYCRQLFKDGEDGAEIVNLIDALTTNKTDFFREPEHFRLLTRQVLPECDGLQRPLRIWSAACSIGAEPYTLAMVLSEYMRARGKGTMPMPVIVATDLCTQVLETARLGIYPMEMMGPVPPEMCKRYVRRAKSAGTRTVRIVPALRSMVKFGHMNLMAPQYPLDADFDIIFCRNVLIYFDRNDQLAVLRRLCSHLRPGGTLAVGHSEAVANLELPLQQIGQTMFRKV